ncbi:hypothetical protein OJ997_11550 [Solirubrobacter phytolaccae]|uniref:VCBS repeat-containing protein n=1 Tax=Solirubrobacter phytolaccae TaxID=1404360 RepID=A0A9X3N7I4_9ACTN|nr:hypothetical protein [Solirubrobacter phytolaccae]MDA0180931.1 hypothetical protein [Solirubrobacter phytolaccae]
MGSLVVVGCVLGPGDALAAACSGDDSYTGACGPDFVIPSWTDTAGWDDPSHYGTIQLGDVNGDIRQELIARADDGIEIFWFDTDTGQWRPQADAEGNRQALTDFATPPPGKASTAQNPALPQYASTIQLVDVDGDYRDEIIARFWDGMRVYKYTPPAGGNAIDGGTWTRVGYKGPFSDAEGYGAASMYSTIKVGSYQKLDPPVLTARQRSTPGAPTIAMYTFANGGWTPVSLDQPSSILAFDDQACSQPSCYLDFGLGYFDEYTIASLYGRTAAGFAEANIRVGDDSDYVLDADTLGNVFADTPGTADCPFSAANGYSGPGAGDCAGSSPSYYETLRTGDINGDGYQELLMRAADGMRVWFPNPDESDGPMVSGTTLGELTGGPNMPASIWGSIRVGDVTGDFKDEVLALEGNGLMAWTYDPGTATWSALEDKTTLQLGAPWSTDPAYYSTLQLGDVDGDGRDDVVGRGPNGIRTWFYNRNGTGGWGRYYDTGELDFQDGQATAYAALNTAMSGHTIPKNSAVRDYWSQEEPPADLTGLASDLVTYGKCDAKNALPTSPVTYSTCTPPDGVSADDWTAVVNELLGETDDASKVLGFIGDLKTMQTNMLIADGAALPAIGANLGLQAGSSATAEFSPQQLWSLIFGIAGSIAGLVQPEVGAGLAVASYIASAIPAASDTAGGSAFNTTYAGLADKFATMADETTKAIEDQSQAIRSDTGLLQVVGDLRRNGTWTLDTVGMESAAEQGFATWVYQNLLPTLYMRYDITNCKNQGWSDPPNSVLNCTVPSGPAVVANGTSFQAIAETYNGENKGIPCGVTIGFFSDTYTCTWTTPPSDIVNRVWATNESLGKAGSCDYVPGQAKTKWTYGCSVEVDPQATIAVNGWGFPNKVGSPKPFDDTLVRASKLGPPAPIRLGKRGRARVRTDVALPPGTRLAGAEIRLDRRLFERGGHGELTHPRGKATTRTARLRWVGGGRYVATTPAGTRVTVLRSHGRARVTLDIRAASLRPPRACVSLPASVRMDADPFSLESRLSVAGVPVRMTHELECRRDARGNVDRLVHRPRG